MFDASITTSRRWMGAVLSLLAGACSSSGSAGPVNLFVGSWLCTDNVSIGGGPEAGAPAASRMSTMDLTIIAPMGDQLSALAQTDAGFNCNLRFAMTGTSASLNTGQSCARTGGVTLAYKNGTANVAGNLLTMNLSFDVAAADPTAASESGTESLGCQRQYAAATGGW
jgi:hypothetical protein